MRSLKKLLAVIVAICVLATFTIPAFAADSATYANADQATKLNSMGLYAGISTTSFDPDLGSTLTREQGMVILLKMFGQLDAANAMTDADADAALAAMTDASQVSSWAKKAVAYVLKNSISTGTSTTTFGPKGTFTGNQFATLILKEAGFTVADWNTAAADLTTKGVAGAGALATTVLTRDDLVGMAFGALKVNNAAGKTIIAALVDAGKVTAAAATAAGVYGGEVTATVAATGAKILTVTFNQAVDTAKATFVAKRDTTTLNVSSVTWSDDKTKAELNMAGKLLEGDYTVTVKGLTATDLSLTIAGVKNEAATKIELNSTQAAAVKGTGLAPAPGNGMPLGLIYKASVGYKVFNQYGEDITGDAIVPQIRWTSTLGNAADDGDGTVTIGDEVSPLPNTTLVGQAFVLTGVLTDTDNGVAVVVTQNMTVGNPAALDSITFGGVYNADGDALATDSDFGDFAIIIDSAKDQYGNDMSVGDLNADLVYSVSNSSIFNVNDPLISDNNGDTSDQLGILLADPANKMDGTATLRLISKTTGKTFSFDVAVKKASTVNSIKLQVPSDVVAVGDDPVEIPFTAIDQNGAEVTDFDVLSNDVILTPNSVDANGDPTADDIAGGNLYWAHDYVKGVAVLKYQAPPVNKGSYILMAMVKDTGKTSQLTINVKDEAAPSYVASLTSDVATNLAKGATTTIKSDYVTVNDGYDREFDISTLFSANVAAPVVGDYRIVVKKDSGTEAFTSLAGVQDAVDDTLYLIRSTADEVTVQGDNKGTSTIDIVIQQYTTVGGVDAWRDVAGSEYQAKENVVEKTGIKSYTVDALGTIYEVTNGDTAALSADDYAKDVDVYGVKADGSKVKMAATDYTVETDTTNLTYDDAIAGKLSAQGAIAAEADDTTATVVVTVDADGAPQVITVPVTISVKAPKAATIALDADNDAYEEAGLISIPAADVATKAAIDAFIQGAVVAGDVVSPVKVTDQYGVRLDSAIVKVIVTNLGDKVIGAAGDAGLVAGDTFNATVVANGKTLSFKVAVTE